MTEGIVLLTGGSGQLDRMFFQHSGKQHMLRLTYYDDPIEAPGHEVIQLDITDYLGSNPAYPPLTRIGGSTCPGL